MPETLTNRYHGVFAVAVSAVFVFPLMLDGLSAAEVPVIVDTALSSAGAFKPAQTDLTEIFLQIATSLKNYGSPVPYLRHMKGEHARIERICEQKLGRALVSRCPSYMDDEYVDRLAANWDMLSPKLGLMPMAKDIGNLMTDAIKGTRGTGTMLVDIFNQHQAKVFAAMTENAASPATYDILQSELILRLGLDKKSVDDTDYSIPQRDAVSYAIIIHGVLIKLFDRLDAALKPEDASRIKTAITAMIKDVGRMAQSELEAGITEWSLKKDKH